MVKLAANTTKGRVCCARTDLRRVSCFSFPGVSPDFLVYESNLAEKRRG